MPSEENSNNVDVEYPYKPATFKEEMLGLFKVFAQVRSRVNKKKEKKDEG